MTVESLAAKIALLVLDIDGVMTDGGLYYDDTGRISKRFNVQDGLGVKLAQSVGLHVAVITGLASGAVEERVRTLGIVDYYAGSLEKTASIDAIRSKYGLEWSQVAYMGDDWVDFGPMNLVGLPVAVSNAQPEVKAIAKHITAAKGGEGAVRELIMLILQSQGKLEPLLTRWMEKG